MINVTLLVEIIGWVGAGLLLSAYLLISNGKLVAKNYLYQGMNIFGSFCLIANTYYYGTMSLVFLNSAWTLIGIMALMKNIRVQ